MSSDEFESKTSLIDRRWRATDSTRPSFALESELLDQGYCFIAGVDEAGRGPIAGPVTAAAVRLNPAAYPNGLNDSKRLSAEVREKLFEELIENADCSIAHVSVVEIDRTDILRAALEAMRQSLEKLSPRPDYALIDGNIVPKNLRCSARAIVKGDGRSVSIAAASILAKVSRDRIMAGYHLRYPEYGWKSNAGYGTKMHLEALRKFGPTPIHRKSFAPVRAAFAERN
ncbi:MAG: ribonuclease HII [Albidovulum sp.]|nr:ribonuclease HII [Albidovulum sp.]MDE0306153.1 ribonuclease HII [Albidovulum sp.]MDE0531861.1 ribonuclease HII [Albidovulum sp.]